MSLEKQIPNPGYDADMLRRAAEACRNFTKQARGGTDWFLWVPAHLDRLADRMDPDAATLDRTETP